MSIKTQAEVPHVCLQITLTRIVTNHNRMSSQLNFCVTEIKCKLKQLETPGEGYTLDVWDQLIRK